MNTYTFIITSLIIVLLPGTGVLYTISTGLTKGKKSSIIASIGCTLGIVPHLGLFIYLSSFLLEINSKAFFIVKIIGAFYLLYLGIGMLNSKSILELNKTSSENNFVAIIIKAILINLLNPKLTLFFFSFLPQYISLDNENYVQNALLLGLAFMLITLIVFICYGLLSDMVRKLFVNDNKKVTYIQKVFGIIFIIFSVKLGLASM